MNFRFSIDRLNHLKLLEEAGRAGPASLFFRKDKNCQIKIANF